MVIPRIGLGTRKLSGDECYTTVTQALQVGYTHIDTASVYHNELMIGNAIAHSCISRHKIRLTTKIHISHYALPELIKQSIYHSLSELQTDYLDLVLLHRPTDLEEHHRVFDVLLGLKEIGIIRHIGVSNFNHTQLLDAITYTHNQIYAYQGEYHICLDQKKLLQTCTKYGIVWEAYSPLGQGKLIHHEDISKGLGRIADKYHVSPSQIMLARLWHQHVVILPKTTKISHLIDNMMIEHIILDDEDHQVIDGFPKTFRYCSPSQIAPIRD